MPVIRGSSAASTVQAEEKRAIVERLAQELGGASTQDGPVVFEVPLEGSDKMDAVVVWGRWKGMSSTLRSDLILEAYGERKESISLPLGVTYQEAIEQHVLPYAVVPMVRDGEANPKALEAAMLKHGGVRLDNGKVALRFPTSRMAEEARRRLCDELPQGYWSLSHSTDPLFL